MRGAMITKNILSTASHMLIKIVGFDINGRDTSTAYQVIEPDGNVVGLFGSLSEAQLFLKMLCRLNSHCQ